MSDDALLGVARAAAQAAAAVLVDTFGGPLEGLDTKSSRTDLVSDADREAERAAVGVITDRRPRRPGHCGGGQRRPRSEWHPLGC